MRILFDQGTPVPLRRVLAAHQVSTAFELGWSNLENGDLLRAAEEQFDLLITTDQNLPDQQNLAGRRLAILVLPTTNWLEISKHQSDVATAVDAMRSGEYRELRWTS
jgi:predicted nuclease of predicted toxin-antitoxin system